MLLTRPAFLGAVYSVIFLSDETLKDNRVLGGSFSFPSTFGTSKENSLGDSCQERSAVAAQMIRNRVAQALDKDPTLAGPLLRLAFHDATTIDFVRTGANIKAVGGPNGSIRWEIDDHGENRALSRPLHVVEGIQSDMAMYSWNVSLADIIAVSGAAAVEHAGGPHIWVQMGRVDAHMPDPYDMQNPVRKGTRRSLVDRTLPSAALDSDGLRLYFSRLGLSEPEFVALTGSHGMGRHVSLLEMPRACLKNLTRSCLEAAPVALPFVASSVDRFDNSYFRALLRWNANEVSLGEVAFIPTDVAQVVDPGLRRHVERFAKDQDDFFQVFTKSYQKLMNRNIQRCSVE